MTLTDEIKKFKDDFLPALPEGVSDTIDNGIEEMMTVYVNDEALKVGQEVPAFSLKSATDKIVSTSELLKKGPIVINFYRGGWCPYCNLELRALQSNLAKFEKLGATLVAISPELPDNSLSTQEKNDLKFPVVSDSNNSVAKKFGLAIDVPHFIVKLTKDVWDLDLTEFNDTNDHALPVPATYVIGQDGIVKYAFVNADYTKRAEPSEILSALK